MKVYVETSDIDVIEDLFEPTNSYECWACNRDDNLEIISLSDYTKQVRKEACEEIKSAIKEKLTYPDNRVDCPFDNGYPDEDTICSVLDQLQGEDKNGN